jgi:hypothetical protein
MPTIIVNILPKKVKYIAKNEEGGWVGFLTIPEIYNQNSFWSDNTTKEYHLGIPVNVIETTPVYWRYSLKKIR